LKLKYNKLKGHTNKAVRKNGISKSGKIYVVDDDHARAMNLDNFITPTAKKTTRNQSTNTAQAYRTNSNVNVLDIKLTRQAEHILRELEEENDDTFKTQPLKHSMYSPGRPEPLDEAEEYIDVNTYSGLASDQVSQSCKQPKKKIKSGHFKIEVTKLFKEKLNGKKMWLVLVAGIAGIILIGGCISYSIFSGDGFGAANPRNKDKNTRPSNVSVTEPITEYKEPDDGFVLAKDIFVSGLDLGGKTLKEARQLIEEKQPSVRKKLEIKVIANDTEVILTEDDFEYSYNADEVIKQIVEYTYESKNASKNKAKASIPTVIQPSLELLEEKTGKFELKAVLKEDSIPGAAEKVAKAADQQVRNARVSEFLPLEENKFVFAEGTNGYYVDKGSLEKDISVFIKADKNSGAISAEVTEKKPEITIDMVRKNIVPLSTFSTYSTNTAAATRNMKRALNACNGSIIEPGDTWSFNSCTGDSNLTENGYEMATVIIDGKYEQGIGGGICQASTTVFNAALFANLEIAERHNHLWSSLYVPAGLDATIDYPYLDLQLKNNTKYQIFLECYVSGQTLVANFYGYKDTFYDQIATFSTVYDVTGKSYSSSAYRAFYKDGQETDREFIAESVYKLDAAHPVRDGDNGTFGKLPGAISVYEEATESPAEVIIEPPATDPPPEQIAAETDPPMTDPPMTDSPATTPPETEEIVQTAEYSEPIN